MGAAARKWSVAVSALVALSACRVSLDEVECASDGDCPSGERCELAVCVSAGGDVGGDADVGTSDAGDASDAQLDLARPWECDVADCPDPFGEDEDGDGADGVVTLTVYVDTANGNDLAAGTPDEPLASVEAAVRSLQEGQRFIVVAGDYAPSRTLQLPQRDDLWIAGGYARGGDGSWQRSPDDRSTIAGVNPVFVSNGVGDLRLEQLAIRSLPGEAGRAGGTGAVSFERGNTPPEAGQSSVAVVADGGVVRLLRTSIVAGRGGNGGAGETGFVGSGGEDADDGDPSVPTPCIGGDDECDLPRGGGAGGAGASCIADEGVAALALGGNGGDGIAGAGEPVRPGSPGAGGEPGGGAGGTARSPDGERGDPGTTGSVGRGGDAELCYAAGAAFSSALSGAEGSAGGTGTVGFGAGGGAGGDLDRLELRWSYSGGGGGGGGGGCGGGGGGGGAGGGASIGVLLIDASLALAESSIQAVSGGAGGAGGAGGSGGRGGEGGNPTGEQAGDRAGGDGERGGTGGSGGPGGGGAGGASVGVVRVGSARIVAPDATASTISAGTGGSGGLATRSGAQGSSAPQVLIATCE